MDGANCPNRTASVEATDQKPRSHNKVILPTITSRRPKCQCDTEQYYFLLFLPFLIRRR